MSPLSFKYERYDKASAVKYIHLTYTGLLRQSLISESKEADLFPGLQGDKLSK